MKHYKNICLIAVIAMVSVLSSVNAQSLYFKKKDGTQTSYIIDNIAKLTFEPGYVTLYQTSGNHDEFELNQIEYLSFQDYTSIEIHQNRFNTNDFVIYPNPVNDILNYRFSNDVQGKVIIEVFSVYGTILFRNCYNSIFETENQIDVSSLVDGVYFLHISNISSQQTISFIKLK